jgi:uncharacterized protein (UPF0333 family)
MKRVVENLMMVVESMSYKWLMASNGNVLSVICTCSTKSEIYADIDKSRKDVSHV